MRIGEMILVFAVLCLLIIIIVTVGKRCDIKKYMNHRKTMVVETDVQYKDGDVKMTTSKGAVK